MTTRAERREAAKVLRAILAEIDAGNVEARRADGPRLTALEAAAIVLETT